MINIHAIGGYDEVGKNMTALEVGDDVIVFDAGLHLPAIVGLTEQEKIPTEKGMRALGALPNDLYLYDKGLHEKVRAFLVSHAHLDHVGAVQYVCPKYKSDVVGTPFTTEVLKSLMADNNFRIPNKIVPIKLNNSYTVRGKSNYRVEFINMTHSTIETAVIAVHTPAGVILYANDYKFDNTPILGDRPNYKRLKELSKIGVKALIIDCLYAPDDRKTPSEKIARGLLQDVLFTTDNKNSGIIITTFSSHIARLKSIVEFGEKLNREIVFMGRSLNKYVLAAQKVGKASFIKNVKIVTYRNQIDRYVKKLNAHKKEFILVCTGHQGEPGSILDRISKGQIKYDLSKSDHIIFSSRTIPTEVNEKSRAELEGRLKKKQVRIFDNVHVSGHGGREDLRDFIQLVKPQHVIPSHGDITKREAGLNLALEMGYKRGVNAHLLSNGEKISLK